MKKQLGFWSILSLVVGNMMGVGIFIMPSLLAPYGSLSLIGWGFTLGGALLIAGIGTMWGVVAGVLLAGSVESWLTLQEIEAKWPILS